MLYCLFDIILEYVIDVIQNSVNVGFSQLIWGFKQTFTIIASWCVRHNRVANVFDVLNFLSTFHFWNYSFIVNFRDIKIRNRRWPTRQLLEPGQTVSERMDIQAGLAFHQWQSLPTFSSSTVRVNLNDQWI